MAFRKLTGILLAAACLATPALAQDAFEHGWTLDGGASHLNFLSVKKGSVMEVSTFATLTGGIDEDGQAEFKVLLDSIDTKVDLRNVRLRFLLFETFQYPEATVTATLTEEMLSGLKAGQETVIDLPMSLDLHGIKKDIEAKVLVQLSDQDNVRVASVDPIILKFADFNFMGGHDKLQETAEVSIVPTTAVSFDLKYARNAQTTPILAAQVITAPVAKSATKPVAAPVPTQVAIETAGYLSQQECMTRFDTLSKNDNISFQVSSSALTESSRPLLNSVAEIVQRCPGMVIEVAGHTDSQGDQGFNLSLSEKRAASVVAFLKAEGVPTARLQSKGYGEARPVATNATREGRRKNRRIEFSVASFDTASN